MNPPSALHGAMSRDRKPFTYTPGGLDLSEIKSQRMAQRLMRNAMNPGVPEVAVNTALPSHNTSVPVVLPNFNCLPVQVFPSMPANPKTLLRSRSNPDPRQAPVQKLSPPEFVNKMNQENRKTSYEDKPTYSHQLNYNRPTSMYEYCTQPVNNFNSSRLSYESDGFTAPSVVNASMTPFGSDALPATISAFRPGPAFAESLSDAMLPEISYDAEICRIPDITNGPLSRKFEVNTNKIEDKLFCKDSIGNSKDLNTNIIAVTSSNIELSNTRNSTIVMSPTLLATKSVEGNKEIDNEQSEVKIIKKQETKTEKVEEHNGKQNGDANEETEMTIKLPTKKSGAKTETKVEVEKKVLPDGTVEEIKTTTTKTTIDGRTEIKTRTETKTIPKAEEYEEEVEEEEEEDEIIEEVDNKHEEVSEEPEIVSVTKITTTGEPSTENGDIVKAEESSEITVSKKVVVIQESEPEHIEEVEEEEIEETDVEEAEPVTVMLKKQAAPELEEDPEPKEIEEEEEEIEVSSEPEKVEIEKKAVVEKVNEIEEAEDDELLNEVEESPKDETKTVIVKDDEEEEEEGEEEEEEYEEAEEEKQETKIDVSEKTEDNGSKQVKENETTTENEETVLSEPALLEPVEPEQVSKIDEHVIPVQISTSEETKQTSTGEKATENPPEYTIPIREPSIPLDKVEDVEIKPIGITPIITKTHTENTEIITNKVDPSGGLSRQTEYNKIENIVTVNRTTKILDQNYESLTQQGIPTVKTYFPPPNIDRISTSPMPSRPYQSVYTPETTTERRHSLLLERLSMERQMPSDIYQYSNQSQDQASYQDEPQSEILTVSNVKPSSITNQQWYQQTKQTQNVLYNNVTSTPTLVGAPWVQPKSPQPQQQYSQPQYHPPSQPQYQTPSQPQFQGTTSQLQFQRGTTPQPQFQKAPAPQPQYQSPFTEPTRDTAPANNYSSYTPTPTWLGSKVDTTPNQYSYVNKEITQSYQSTLNTSTPQYSADYVPPPWEQDSSYISVNNTSEKFYREIPQSNAFNASPSTGWTTAPPPAKFTKPAPIAYVPPAPNQSFVKTGSCVEPSRQLPGRKTYYSEYERRYITVPESTYIPTETKFQPQPDPSPQYYYDNNEPNESVEPQWRRELREFTEKTSQTTEQTNVRPPWEVDSKYTKTPTSTYTPTPTWSQTLRPQSYRKRSFESEFVSQEWPKTNTLGRGRPLSTMGKSFEGAAPERTRGVSVDRYNPNNYQPPAEHPPVQSHTLTTPLPHASYHNPNVPAYHARASAEPREQPVNYQQRVYREARASPLQSRSFKYLQWITGTEN